MTDLGLAADDNGFEVGERYAPSSLGSEVNKTWSALGGYTNLQVECHGVKAFERWGVAVRASTDLLSERWQPASVRNVEAPSTSFHSAGDIMSQGLIWSVGDKEQVLKGETMNLLIAAFGDIRSTNRTFMPYPCGKAPRMKEHVAEAPDRLARIVHGKNAVKGQSPWQIFLTNKGEFLCGAVLIAPQWVLTAAHCTHDKRSEDLQIVAGEHMLNIEEGTEQKRNVSEMINHENYNPETVDNDIAMLKLDVPITLNDYAVPICLPEPDFAVRELTQIRFSTVTGWGRVLEGGLVANILQILQVPVVWTSLCRSTTKFKITDNMFCAGYYEASKDTCKGDSGGPHVTKYKGTWFLTGIVSWGEGCAREGKYGTYTKIHKYFHWIRQFLNPANLTLSASFENLTESSEPLANTSHVSFLN
ncbi:coagulation factor IX-like [Mobula birostris]|uniref:coagulation factor IX-like n=1 Tax=Mobula birostris TaxID=1983395 RepID=UPI003B285750